MSENLAEGLKEETTLREAGFSEDEVQGWKAETSNKLRDAGFSFEEIDSHFGVKKPDMSAMKSYFEENLKKIPASLSPDAPEGEVNPATIAMQSLKGPLLPKPGPEYADSFLEALGAGWQMGNIGMIVKGGMPDTVLPEQAPMHHRIASQVGTLAGDSVSMVAGGLLGGIAGAATGGAVGTAVPAIGNAAGAAAGGKIGSSAGAFALPAAIRTTLMQHYEKGDIQDFPDFWERSSAVFLETMKAGTIGAATGGAGLVAGKLAQGAAPLVTTGAVMSSEIATMVTVGAAMEGHVPSASEFAEAAIVIGGMHGFTGGVSKLRTIYGKTGVRPAQVADMVRQDPVMLGEVLSTTKDVPKALEGLVEGTAKTPRQEMPIEVKTEIGEKISDKLVIEPMTGKTANEKISDRIVSHPEAKKERLDFDRLYEETIDYLSPLKDLEKTLLGKGGAKALDIESSVYGLARTMAGLEGKIQSWYDHGPTKFETGERTGTRGLKKVFDEMGTEMRNQGREYAVAKRAIEKEAQGVKTGVDLAAAKEVVKTTSQKVKDLHGEVLKFRNETFDFLVEAGLIAKDKAAAMKARNEDYVPFYRLQEEANTARGAGKSRSSANPVKEMKGSEREILDPYESIVRDTAIFVRLAEKNRMLKNVSELAKQNPEMAKELGIEKVAAENKAIEVKDAEVAKWMKENGVEGEASDFTIFRPKDKSLRENEIAFSVNGKREVWTVNKEVKRALDNMDFETGNFMLKFLNKFSSSLKTGVSLSPEFMLRNPIRDQLSAFVVSKNGYLPVIDALRGLGSIMKKDADYQMWLEKGGANSALTTFDAKSLTLDLAKIDKETGLTRKMWNVVKSPVHALQLVSMLAENSTRVGEYKKAISKGKSPKQAAFESRDLIDFAKVGAKARAVNQIVAYWNASVQARVRLVESVRDDAVGTSARLAASTVIPTVLLWWAQKDDERIQEVPDWVKDNFQVVSTDKWEDVDPRALPPEGSQVREFNGKMQVNNGIIFRIPLSQENALVSAFVRRTLDAFYKEDPGAFEGFEKSVLAFGQTEFMPNAFLPVIEQMANHSFFTDRPLVPHGLEKVLPEHRYTEYTSETAKLLGKTVASIPGGKELGIASPMVIENYVRQWTGTTGAHALRLADEALVRSGAVPDPMKPEEKFWEHPVMRAFSVRYPTASAQSIEDFRKRYDSTMLRVNTIKKQTKRGDFASVEAEYAAAEAEGKLAPLKGVNDALANARERINLISGIKDMPTDEKRQLIDGELYQMIAVTRGANEVLREVDKDLGKK